MYSNEIYHHGIKGQKWGLRRFQNKDGTRTAAGKKRERESLPHKIFSKFARKKSSSEKQDDGAPKAVVKRRIKNSKSEKTKAKYLSDDELNRRIERLKLEKSYNQLLEETRKNTPEAKRVSAAKKLVSEIANASIKNIGTQLVTYGLGSAANAAYKSITGSDKDIVNPKKGQKDK